MFHKQILKYYSPDLKKARLLELLQSHNDEDVSDGEGGHSGGEHDDLDSCDEMRRHGGLLAEHGDVLAKLKMQVRDIKDDYDSGGGGRSLNLNFPLSNRVMSSNGSGPDGFQLPVPFPFPHPAAAFLPPMAPQPTAPSSGSSHSSEGSASSQHTWSFEEQFKQVRQLYEINDDPKRKEFLDELFSFMQKRGTPINRLPIMAKSVLDLYELYNLVIARGGLVDVINKKLWQEIIKGLHLPSSITSAAFTLRTQYMKYLYPYECEKRRLSTPAELQAAIDGNRREGRRSSYGQYDSMQQRSPNPGMHVSPLSLVSQQQQQLAAARMMGGGMTLHNGAHHPSHPQPLGQPINGGPLPGLAPNEFEARMMEYVKLLNKEIRGSTITPPRQGEISPPNATSPLNHLEMSRMTLWNLYNNNQPNVEPQKEPINLSEPSSGVLKREPECRESPPPPKRPVKEEEEPEPSKAMHSPSTHIKINSRGDARNGDNSLVVSMELNGITYQGVLFAQNPTSSRGRTALAS
ncbi:protein dead ringer-like isoform X2 [Diabrotica virgifera virgifera]|uniref:Protein dead ringer n=1 Tax=Diabrotica virgifera virgifera TaxID=50390 RepID=A0ABM5KVF1_DIAVI|nr:protein dead ringer-like isoform X2 [Diabrotica virgifera virgifera]